MIFDFCNTSQIFALENLKNNVILALKSNPGVILRENPKNDLKIPNKILKNAQNPKNCQKQSEKRKKKQAKKYSRVDFFLPFSPLVFGSRPLKSWDLNVY